MRRALRGQGLLRRKKGRHYKPPHCAAGCYGHLSALSRSLAERAAAHRAATAALKGSKASVVIVGVIRGSPRPALATLRPTTQWWFLTRRRSAKQSGANRALCSRLPLPMTPMPRPWPDERHERPLPRHHGRARRPRRRPSIPCDLTHRGTTAPRLRLGASPASPLTKPF